MPTTARVSQGRDTSSGAIDISYSRKVSAPYSAYSSSGLTEFFRLLPIFPNSRTTGCPCQRKPSSRLGDLGSLHDLAAPIPVRVRLDVALVVEAAVRLPGTDVAEVVEDLVPEPGVQQVQHRVFYATHVQVHPARIARASRPHPVPLHLRIAEGRFVDRVEIAQLVPARTGPLGHHVQLPPVAPRAVAQVELNA